MRTFTDSVKPLAAASLLVAAATACSSSSAVPPSGVPGSGIAPTMVASTSGDTMPAKKKKQKPLLYVAVQYENEVLVFDQTKKKNSSPKYTITGGIYYPQGIATDKSGNLYVANENSVTIYAPGATSPSTTITAGVSWASDVAVDSGGNVYVTNNGTPSEGKEWINFYPAGSTSPTYSWYAPSTSDATTDLTGVMLEYPSSTSQSNILVSYFTVSRATGLPVGDVLFCEPAYTTCFADDYSFGETGGITLQSSKASTYDYLVIDQNIPGYDNVNASGVTPVKAGGTVPDYLTFNSTGTELYISDYGSHSVIEYSYPSLKTLNTFKIPGSAEGSQLNLPAGVATYPSGNYL